MTRPDFVIIGAMKCGTSTLAAQLSAQEGVFVTTPKEPNFFSDDPVYAKGMGWYESLYDAAAPGDLKGEASTHYAKSPTWPNAAERLHAAAPGAKLIYLMRDPVARLVSHYIHEWTMGKVPAGGIETALETMPELIDYSRYAMQAAPWRARFGDGNLLLLRLEDMNRDPQGTLDRVGAFLGRPGAFRWAEDLGAQNVSAERIRRFPLYDLVIEHPAAAWLRRTLVPQSLRDAVKGRLRMRERPSLDDAARARIEALLAEDIAFWRAAAG
ncbi:Sulfotransferase domain-containing protein [Albimonas donghaensis]|uniref:Sulfotransferase domain-containing protein n=1 Tax=Albimonas donghaensis TaxID=356660 RepID=A0A1H3FPU2_9RHOB|nr:sulfotransferase [Albimonas donghaensis]SDX92139.1 Sulfotransferase domain-containing protein [Albimonas donghaensis]